MPTGLISAYQATEYVAFDCNRLRRRHRRRRDRNWSDIRRLRRASSSISISMAIEANRYVPPIIRRTSSAEIVDGSLLGALPMEEQPIMISVAASVQIAR